MISPILYLSALSCFPSVFSLFLLLLFFSSFFDYQNSQLAFRPASTFTNDCDSSSGLTSQCSKGGRKDLSLSKRVHPPFPFTVSAPLLLRVLWQGLTFYDDFFLFK